MQLLKKKSSPSDEETAASKPPRRPLKKGPVILTAVVLVGLAVFLFGGKSDTAATLALADTTVLSRSDLQNTISATGTVESASSMMVYSTVAYTVQEVPVEVGDYVEEGQLLARLDSQNIQDQIASQEASLSVSGGTSAASIASAKDSYEQFKAGLEDGMNSSILSAESAVTNAYNSYTNAVTTYERYKEGLDAGENATLLNQDAALRGARTTMETAQETYTNALDALYTAEDDINDAQADLTDAQNDLAEAERDRDRAGDDLDRAERQLKNMGSGGYTTAINELQAEITALQSQIAAGGEEAAGLTAQLESKKAELSSLTQAQTDFSTRQSELTQDVSKYTQEKATYESKAAQLESTVKSYENALKQAEKARDNCEKQVATAQRNLTDAETAYAAAITQYNATVTTVDNTLADYATAVETAYEAYQSAQTNLQSAKVNAQNQLQSYKDNLNSAYAGANKAVTEVSLRQLRADLADTEIKAPMAGTVTAVYAEVGSAGSGLLFVIEDVDHLVVSTSVKDYDVGTVKTGMPVTIKSDSTGDTVYDGKITTIAPTAAKAANGATNTSGGDVTFDTDVEVLSQETGLRVGMSVRLNFVVDSAKNVLSVPYGAVYSNDAGEDCVLAALEQEDGTYLLAEYPITIGMESDLDIVVEGPDLKEGLRIVSEPDVYRPYIGQTLEVGASMRTNSFAAMMGGM